MTPIAYLTLFCSLLALVAVGRAIRATEQRGAHSATAVTVFGITVLSFVWLTVELEGLLPFVAQIALGVGGGILVCLGFVLLARAV